ncbi:MAG: DUF3883 domain-containing protein [Kiritimatiellae bacterium]|nr:DUF3883 domain-containing protein [Kiritimatiellia bacterium]
MLKREGADVEVMNLIGYGMAKFNYDFIYEFGVKSKQDFGRYFINLGLAKTIRSVLNRQDSFDPYFDNGRRGWYQRRQREHIKLFIDSLFGNEDAHGFANIVKLYIQSLKSGMVLTTTEVPPTIKTKFKQLQETGREAEFYFMNNFRSVPVFERGVLEDARLWGDGYDFQIQVGNDYLLAEVKGLRDVRGSIRMTRNEYFRALEYKTDYYLVVVSNLMKTPRLRVVESPAEQLHLTVRDQKTVQTNYYSEVLVW